MALDNRDRWGVRYEWKIVALLSLGFGLVGVDRFMIMARHRKAREVWNGPLKISGAIYRISCLWSGGDCFTLVIVTIDLSKLPFAIK